VTCVAGLDFVDLVVFERHEVFEDEGKGVDSFPDGVDAGSLEEEIAPRPGGAPVCGFDDALGLELPKTRISSSMYGASASGWAMENLAIPIMCPSPNF
jgi:hypothetical protein